MLSIFAEPYIALFVIMMFGVALSKLSYKKIGLGSSAIVIVAIIFGHFGIQTPQSIEKIGLILFIFSVGIEAGPGFFQSFKTYWLFSVNAFFPTLFPKQPLLYGFSVRI